MDKDRHHIFYRKKDYSRGQLKVLRSHWYCTVEIPRDTLHRKLHAELSRVPVPRASNIHGALYQLSLLEKARVIHPYDNLETRLNILMALFDCCEPETYNALKKQYDIVRRFYKKSPRD